MAKRKVQHATEPVPNGAPAKKAKAEQPASKPKTALSSTSQEVSTKTLAASTSTTTTTTTIQIIAGSYDRILHGITCAIEPSPSPSKTSKPSVSFADTFLFTAHTSAIRCLALSPPSAPAPGQSQKIMLATGATDERINVYNLSAHPPSRSSRSAAALLSSAGAPRPILENSSNRELGTLLHHSSTVTQLAFPTRGKLLSSSEDSTVAVTRTRDWSLLSAIKSPVPKLVGRPSGDTAAHGAGPRGVNSFAVHPSLKLMISVGKGERCMRLWNLVTGKKAGVLNFGREVLDAIGEGRIGMGEGRRVVWGAGREGDEFAVAFDRDVVVFGMDSRPRCRVMARERTKVHEIEYVKLGEREEGKEEESLLAVSTEDGRVLFFSTRKEDLTTEEEEKADEQKDGKKAVLPNAKLVAQLGGKEAGVTSRIKDFKFLPVDGEDGERFWYVITGSSDGKLRVWKLEAKDLTVAEEKKQVGTLLGAYDTQNRITCVEAFIMIPRPEGLEDSEDEFEEEVEAEDAAESGDDSD
ncbi:WD40 repeat-like protein [Coniochaeta sp. PMI_546]|nr:WD40 repeat-like protein [Coniochaeta sp. PMI_546]